jgi:hypothetical protein
MMEAVPRGIRNNNPGNIRRDGTAWVGMAGAQNDDSFVQFETPVAGLRALARDLTNKQKISGLNTVQTIINKYAPPNENNTAAYIASVAAAIGVKPNDPLDLVNNAAQLKAFMRAVVKHENGRQPYSDKDLDTAIAARFKSQV